MRYVLYTIHFPTGPPWAMLLPEDVPPPSLGLAGLNAHVRAEPVLNELAGLQRLEEIGAWEQERAAVGRRGDEAARRDSN